MKHLPTSIPLLLLSIAWPGMARAQIAGDNRHGPLINLDGPDVAKRGTLAGRLDVRFFDHAEDIVYTSIGIRYGLYDKLEIGLRGVTGARKSLALPGGGAIFHGGRDAELYGKFDAGTFGRAHLAILGGVSSPDTPAQNQAMGTVSAVAAVKLHDRVTGYLNPRAVFPEGNTIVGIGLGASARLADRVHLIGDWTGIVSGDNTRDTTTGARKRGDIWGVALRFSSAGTGGQVDFDLGYGNATGSTTGFSLTPGLGNSAGFYFALTARH